MSLFCFCKNSESKNILGILIELFFDFELALVDCFGQS